MDYLGYGIVFVLPLDLYCGTVLFHCVTINEFNL